MSEIVSGEVFCVGTSNKVSIKSIFNLMNKKYNKEFKANYLEAINGDVKELVCNNSKIKKILNINNFLKFEDGIINL